jgi:gamma-glutamylcyclotransferase (GGCT)/AIG2-like uncharacterized protein YtfP
MMSKTGSIILLFSYGTLQKTSVQVATFGRALKRRADALPGYRIAEVAIIDPAIRVASGLSHNANAVPSPDPTDLVNGTVLEITEQELHAADKYEAPADYQRIRVTLQSGNQAWIYVHKPPVGASR